MTKRLPAFHPRSRPFPKRMTVEGFRAAFVGEGDYVEFKQSAGQRGLERSITAFSNADGGVILIGVGDDGSLLGRSLTPSVEDSVHQAALTIHDAGRYWINEVSVEGTPVTVVSIEKRSEGFAQTADGQVLVRRGERSIPLIGSELQRFVMGRALQRFDTTPSEALLSEASPDLLEELREAYRWKRGNIEDRLREHGLLTTDDGTARLTIAGALALLSDPSKKLGKAFIEVLRYPDEGVNYERRVEVGGPVQAQVAQATELVMDELGSDLIVSGLRRYELPKIPKVVIREAIANAVAHRKYEEFGRSVRVELRPDAVIVISPGGLPEPVTVDNIREAQSARNLAVLKFLRRLDLAEDNGRGVDVMQDEMTGALLDQPKFEDLNHAVEVRLPIRGPISPQERAWVLEVERRGKLDRRDRITLVHAARGEVLTNARVRELLNADSRDARESLKRLRDAGFLEQTGERGGTAYSLSKAVAAPAAFRLSPPDLEDFIVRLADDEMPILTNSTVRSATGLDRIEALRILDKLVREGRLRRVGERRGTFYVTNNGQQKTKTEGLGGDSAGGGS